jgi:hypothetical protein
MYNKFIDDTRNIFKKTVRPIGNFFKKEGSNLLRKTSHTLGDVGNILGNVNNQANKFLNSNFANTLADTLPYGQVGKNLLVNINKGIGNLSNLTQQASNLTNKKNYSGSAGDVVTNALQRAKNIKDDASKFTFH